MNTYYRHFKRLAIILIILSIILLARYYNIAAYFTFEHFNQYKHQLQKYVQDNYIMSVISFIGTSIVIATFMIPVSIFIGVIGGFLFGLFWGTLYTVIGATIGATGAFLLVRYVIGSHIQDRYHTQLASFNKSMDEYGVYYLLMMHLITALPFALISTLAGLTKMPVWTFVWISALGITPGTFVLALTGTGLTDMSSMGDIFSTKIIIAFAVLGLLASLPLILKKFFKRDLLGL